MGGCERQQGHEEGGERRRRGRRQRGIERGEREQRRNIGRGVKGGRRGTRPADGVAMGHARKRGKQATGGCEGRREWRRESHLWDGQRGETRSRHGAGKQHGGRKGGCRERESNKPWVVGRNSGGRKASGVGPDPHGVEWEEGGRKASGVEKNPREGPPWSGRGGQIIPGRLDLPRSGRGGVESSRDDSTPNGGGGSSHGRMT